jgi:hypothetical protein
MTKECDTMVTVLEICLCCDRLTNCSQTGWYKIIKEYLWHFSDELKNELLEVKVTIDFQRQCHKNLISVQCVNCSGRLVTTNFEIPASKFQLWCQAPNTCNFSMNYFNMNTLGPGIFRAWTHRALNGEWKTSAIEQYRQERKPQNISGHTT